MIPTGSSLSIVPENSTRAILSLIIYSQMNIRTGSIKTGLCIFTQLHVFRPIIDGFIISQLGRSLGRDF